MKIGDAFRKREEQKKSVDTPVSRWAWGVVAVDALIFALLRCTGIQQDAYSATTGDGTTLLGRCARRYARGAVPMRSLNIFVK